MLFAVSCRTGNRSLSRALGSVVADLECLRESMQGNVELPDFKGVFVNFVDSEVVDFSEGKSGGILFLDLAAKDDVDFDNLNKEELIKTVENHVISAIDRSGKLAEVSKARMIGVVEEWAAARKSS